MNEDDVLEVPGDVWEAEKNYTKSHPDEHDVLRQAGSVPPATACVNLKVIYNNDWVQASANGDAALAAQRAADVVTEAGHIYNAKYAAGNQLGTVVTFNLIGGGKAEFGV